MVIPLKDVCICSHPLRLHKEGKCEAHNQVFTFAGELLYDKPCTCVKFVEDSVEEEVDLIGPIRDPLS